MSMRLIILRYLKELLQNKFFEVSGKKDLFRYTSLYAHKITYRA